MTLTDKLLRRSRRFVDNPINVQFVLMGVIGEVLIQTRIVSNLAETFLMGIIMLFTMLLVFPNVSWKKPYFTLPWKEYTLQTLSQSGKLEDKK